VTIEDAERAIKLMSTTLRQFGFDYETGAIDIDRAEGTMTSTQRSKIRIVLDIIDDLTNSVGKVIPTEEIIKRAKDEGVDDADDILKRMKREGLIFEPRPDFVQKT
jgi:replicative DNA helicase Mcm